MQKKLNEAASMAKKDPELMKAFAPYIIYANSITPFELKWPNIAKLLGPEHASLPDKAKFAVAFQLAAKLPRDQKEAVYYELARAAWE